MSKFTKYDIANYLKTEEDMAAYLDACLEEGEPSLVIAALNDIAKSNPDLTSNDIADLLVSLADVKAGRTTPYKFG